MKCLLFAILSQISIPSTGQTLAKTPPVGSTQDTVYIGINNWITVDNPGKLRSVKADKASVELQGKRVLLMPRDTGRLTIYFHYMDTTITKSFTAYYLPDPSKKSHD